MNEQEFAAIAEEIETYTRAALERVRTSPPEDTVALAVAFQVTIDLLGDDAVRVTVPQFFGLFADLYRAFAPESI